MKASDRSSLPRISSATESSEKAPSKSSTALMPMRTTTQRRLCSGVCARPCSSVEGWGRACDMLPRHAAAGPTADVEGWDGDGAHPLRAGLLAQAVHGALFRDIATCESKHKSAVIGGLAELACAIWSGCVGRRRLPGDEM